MLKKLPMFYTVLAALALPAFVLFMWGGPEIDREFFCKGDESCFRQWVSALSGWAAFGAAVSTMHYLREQIASANEHQRENVELTISARLAVAKSFLWKLMVIKREVEQIELLYPDDHHWQPLLSNDKRLADINAGLKNLQAELEDFRIQKFEGEIGTRWPANFAHEAISVISHKLDNAVHIHPPVEVMPIPVMLELERGIRNAVDLSKNYAASGQQVADAFIGRWETRVHNL